MIKGNGIFAVCLGLSLGSLVFGQAQSGTVVGVVRDQGGAVVPGATVTIVNEGTNFTRSLVTNPSGEYTAYSFPTGRLTVSVAQPGFQKLVRSGVELTAADTLTVDLTLTLGNVQETVQVSAEASLLQSQTATVSSLIDNRQIIETPLNGRSFTQIDAAQHRRLSHHLQHAGDRGLRPSLECRHFREWLRSEQQYLSDRRFR